MENAAACPPLPSGEGGAGERSSSVRFQPNLQIKQQLLRYILEGKFEIDQALPSIESLSATFGVSTKTVQKAIHALSADGVIEAKRGIGLFVKSLRPPSSQGRRVGLLHANQPQYLRQKPYPQPVIASLRRDLGRAGLNLILCPLVQFDRLVLAETLFKLKLNALLLFEVDSDLLIFEVRDLRLPLVSMDYDAYRHGISSVAFDNAYGTFQAAKYLVQHGHQHIAFLRPLLRNPIHNNRSLDAVEDDRLEGYRIAMLDAGLPLVIREVENKLAIIQQDLAALFSRRPAPTAIVCTGDWFAGVVAAELQHMGFRIPEDVSVIGFGDSGVEFAPGRRISSVHVDAAGMGTSAARLIVAAMAGGAPPQREILPTRLVLYESVQDAKK